MKLLVLWDDGKEILIMLDGYLRFRHFANWPGEGAGYGDLRVYEQVVRLYTSTSTGGVEIGTRLGSK